MCFFFNDTATTEIYTLSLHDALPILRDVTRELDGRSFDACVSSNRTCEVALQQVTGRSYESFVLALEARSEEHTSELQSHVNLVCRLLLEKKKNNTIQTFS